MTNGQIRDIAGVDTATAHAWMYLDRELPEAATQRLHEYYEAHLGT
jgi:hypothetical protein